MTQRACRSASAASSRARAAARASRSIASRALSASATFCLGRLDLGLGGALGLRGDLDLLDERVAAVALGEHAVGAAGRDLAQLAGGRRPDAAVLGDGDAAEVGIERLDRLDDPDVGEDGGGEALGGGVAGGA